jgi:tripartite ATP-independent transporter DctP family solute receptor
MMFKRFRCLVLTMVIIMIIASCTTFAAAKPIKLIIGHVWTAEDYYHKADLMFKEMVEKNSKGKILVDIFPGSQLGNQQEMLQGTRSGAQQMTVSSLSGSISGLWPRLATFGLPYLIRDYEHMLKIAARFNSFINPDEMIAKTGVRIIGFKFSPSRQLTTNFPVNKLEDIKGLKLRVSTVPVSIEVWKALGCVPTVVPTAEIYTALATGTVDAQENPLPYIWANKFYEQQKYCALTEHSYEFHAIIINPKFWNDLTTVQRKIIQNAVDKCSKFTYKSAIEKGKECQQLLSNVGMKFTKPELTSFREKAKTVWGKFGDEKLIKKIEAIR